MYEPGSAGIHGLAKLMGGSAQRLHQLIVEHAAIHDRLPERSITVIPHWPPDRVASSLVVVAQLEPNPATGFGFGAVSFAHDGWVAAKGPPIEGVINGIHSFTCSEEAPARSSTYFPLDALPYRVIAIASLRSSLSS